MSADDTRRADVARALPIMRASLEAQRRAILDGFARADRWIAGLAAFAEGAELPGDLRAFAAAMEHESSCRLCRTGQCSANPRAVTGAYVSCVPIPAQPDLLWLAQVGFGTTSLSDWAEMFAGTEEWGQDIFELARQAASDAGLDDLVPDDDDGAELIPFPA